MKNPKDANSIIFDLDDHKESERNKQVYLPLPWKRELKVYLNGEGPVIEVKKGRAVRRREEEKKRRRKD